MRKFLRTYRFILIQAAVISAFLNLLLLAPTVYMLQVFDRVFTSRSVETLFWLTLITVVLLLLYMVLEWLRARLLASTGALVDRLLGATVMRCVLDDAAQPGHGQLAFLVRDVGVLRNFFAGSGIASLLEAPWLPFYILIIFLFHPALGILALVSASVLVALAVINFRMTQRGLEDVQGANRQAARYVDVGARNAEVVKAMGMADQVVAKWSELNRKALYSQADVSKGSSLISGASKFSRQVIQVLMLGLAAYLVIAQHVTPGVTIASTLILGRALAPVEQLIANWKLIGEARAAYGRLEKALEALSLSSAKISLPPLQGMVAADKLVFGFKSGKAAVIRNVGFQLEAGEFLGIIGPSASGKSTLVRLLTGVWRPQSGSVSIDGAQIDQWNAAELGRQMGYLPQDVELFPGTVAENIARLGSFSDKDVIEAAQRANVHELILALPEGYQTDIGPNGENLSGGQRQRVALARALYGRPQLVVLDEPNANLDADGEIALLAALDQLKRDGATVIMVCHKPSLLVRADKLLVLKEGTLAAFGPRNEVLGKLAPVSLTRSTA